MDAKEAALFVRLVLRRPWDRPNFKKHGSRLGSANRLKKWSRSASPLSNALRSSLDRSFRSVTAIDYFRNSSRIALVGRRGFSTRERMVCPLPLVTTRRAGMMT